MKLDVSNPDQVRSLVKGLPQEVQNVDILVNNAYAHCLLAYSSGLVKGIDRVGEIAEDDIKVMFDTNVTGLINVRPRISVDIDDTSMSSKHEITQCRNHYQPQLRRWT